MKKLENGLIEVQEYVVRIGNTYEEVTDVLSLVDYNVNHLNRMGVDGYCRPKPTVTQVNPAHIISQRRSTINSYYTHEVRVRPVQTRLLWFFTITSDKATLTTSKHDIDNLWKTTLTNGDVLFTVGPILPEDQP